MSYTFTAKIIASVLIAALLGCKKTNSGTDVATLDTMVNARIKPRACGVQARVLVPFTIRIEGYVGQEQRLAALANQTLGAAPVGLQRLFKALDGQIVISPSPLAHCTGQSGTRDGVTCWDYLPLSYGSSLSEQGQLSKSSTTSRPIIAISGAGNGAIIAHSLLRAFGFLYASKFVEITKLDDAVFQQDLAALANAVIEDVRAGGLDKEGSFYRTIVPTALVSLPSSQRLATLSQSRDSRVNYAKAALFAEAFDSFYCDPATTRAVMKQGQAFAGTGAAFANFERRFVQMSSVAEQAAQREQSAALAGFEAIAPLFIILLAVLLGQKNKNNINPYPPGTNYGYGGYSLPPNNLNNNNNNNYNNYNTPPVQPLNPIQPNLNNNLGTGGGNVAEVIRLSNEFRAQQGKAALTADQTLNGSCAEHAGWMARNQSMQHYDTRSDYPGPKNVAENIAHGQRTPQEVVNSWINSPGHRANLVGNYKTIGAGDVSYYWCQQFR